MPTDLVRCNAHSGAQTLARAALDAEALALAALGGLAACPASIDISITDDKPLSRHNWFEVSIRHFTARTFNGGYGSGLESLSAHFPPLATSTHRCQ